MTVTSKSTKLASRALPPVCLSLLLSLLAACSSDRAPEATPSNSAVSPWQSLSAEEITEAAKALLDREGDGIVINRMSLKEPNKQTAKAWSPDSQAERGADLFYRSGKASFRASFDFGTQTLSASEQLVSGQ